MANSELNQEYIYKSSKPVTTQVPKNVSIPELLASKLEQMDPEAVALIDGITNSTLSYGELHRQAQVFASDLVNKLGVTADDIVMFYFAISIEYMVAMLGTVYLGLSICPVRPASGPFEITEHISETSATVFVFGPEKLVSIMKALNSDKYAHTMKQLKVLIDLESRDKPEQALTEHETMKDKQVHTFKKILKMSSASALKSIPYFRIETPEKKHFLIAFTSGTTGKPKGATHRSFKASFTGFDSGTSGEHLMVWYLQGHLSGTLLIYYGLYAGHSMILFPNSDLEPLLSAVHKVKNLLIPPNHATALANTDYNLKYDLSSLRCISHGGSVIASSHICKIAAKYKVATLNGYASTEFLSSVEPNVTLPESEHRARCIGTVKPGVAEQNFRF